MKTKEKAVREHVLQEMRETVHTLAHKGMAAKEIEELVNRGGRLSETERDVLYLVVYHATANAQRMSGT